MKSSSVILEQQSQNDDLDLVIAWFWALVLSRYPNNIHISDENTYHQNRHDSSDYRYSLK